MEARTTRTLDGRVTVTQKDDRGTASAVAQGPGQVLGVSDFREVLRLPFDGATRRGHLMISAVVGTNGAFANQFVAIEYNIIGYVGSAGLILFSSAIDAGYSSAEFDWVEPDTWSEIGIEARQIVDGLPSGITTGIDVLYLSVAGHFWR